MPTARESLVAVWGVGRPAGVTGTNFNPGDPAPVKLDAINTWVIAKGVADRAILDPSLILNTIVPADLAALTQLQTLQLTLLLSGTAVDASQGTTIRAAIQNMFVGKTATLAALGALVAPFDSPTIRWRESVGFSEPVGTADLKLAGLT